jgi:hypothetical protein
MLMFLSGIAQTAIKTCNDPEIQANTISKYKNMQKSYKTLPSHTRQVHEVRLAGPSL